MKRTYENIMLDSLKTGKMLFLVGPRQVGKTTLAKNLLIEKSYPNLYFNWDDASLRRKISKEPYGFLDGFVEKKGDSKPLIVFDEIHKFPKWKNYLKGFWDTRKDLFDILVTGSGRLDVYQRGGDSLLGRYHQYRLHPFSLRELLNPTPPEKDYNSDHIIENLKRASGSISEKIKTNYNDLFKWGGFPDPFLKKDENELRLWHHERRRLIIREDLRDLTRIQLISHVEELIELLILRTGSLLSYNSLREDLQVAADSVNLWIDFLKRLYFVYLIRPYAGKIARALKKEPKVYLWDWSEVADKGARFENLIASHLLKWCHFTQDLGYEPLELHFVRDKEKREVDFLITKNKKPWALIETKFSDTAHSPALNYFADKLKVEHKFLVVHSLDSVGFEKDVTVVGAPIFCSLLPV